MAKRREVFLSGKYLSFDRADTFQVQNKVKSAKLDRSPIAGPSASKPTDHLSESETSETSSVWSSQSEVDSDSQQPLGRVVTQVDKKKRRGGGGGESRKSGCRVSPSSSPDMFQTVGTGLEHQTVREKLPTLSASGKSLKSFINTAIDPHVLRVLPDQTVKISDATLAGANFRDISSSMTSSKSFVTGEDMLLPILLKHSTKRIKSLLVPAKRNMSRYAPKAPVKKINVSAAKTILPCDDARKEIQVATTSLMGHVAPPIQKTPTPSETNLVAPSVGSSRWYHI